MDVIACVKCGCGRLEGQVDNLPEQRRLTNKIRRCAKITKYLVKIRFKLSIIKLILCINIK